MNPTFESGRLWVETRLRELAQEHSWLVDCMEWLQPSGTSARKIRLKIWRDGEFRIVEFRRTELVGVEGDPEIQRRVGERIRERLVTGGIGSGSPCLTVSAPSGSGSGPWRICWIVYA